MFAGRREERESGEDLEGLKREIIDTRELFKGRREIILWHQNNEYRLMITKSGKLILNK